MKVSGDNWTYDDYLSHLFRESFSGFGEKRAMGYISLCFSGQL
jgi:hypothetical protein